MPHILLHAGTRFRRLGPWYRLSTKGETMKSGLRDQAEGTAKEAKGKAKQKLAQVTGDPQKSAEGSVDEARGKFQKKTGEIKRDVLRE